MKRSFFGEHGKGCFLSVHFKISARELIAPLFPGKPIQQARGPTQAGPFVAFVSFLVVKIVRFNGERCRGPNY